MRKFNRTLLITVGVAFAIPGLSDDWSYPLAHRLAAASNCAYEHSADAALNCLHDSQEFPEASAGEVILKSDLGPKGRDGYLLINSSGKDLILAIRGTQPPTDQGSTHLSIALDWLNDTMVGTFSPPAFENKGFHKGFLEAWENIVDDLRKQPKLKTWISTSHPFYLAGHSKGAAVAVLGTDKVCKEGSQAGLPMPAATYAFEPARSLTHQKAVEDKNCFNNVWRFEFRDDMVPHIPFTANVAGNHSKLIEKAYDFKNSVNKNTNRINDDLDLFPVKIRQKLEIQKISAIPDYDSVGNLYYVNNTGIGNVVINQDEALIDRVKSLDEHLSRLNLEIPEFSQDTQSLVDVMLHPNSFKEQLEKIVKSSSQEQCRTLLSLVDDHILYYQWLTKAAGQCKTGNNSVTIKDDEMQNYAFVSRCGPPKAK